MNDLYLKIDEILRNADIEGLIESGAPLDEYSSEARDIASALSNMSRDDINYESVLALISLVFVRSFQLSEDSIQQRLPVIIDVSNKICKI